MAGNITLKYGSNGQSFTITLTSLGSGAGRVATAIDNTTNLFNDALCELKFKTGTVSGNKQLIVYAVASNDGGTTYTDNVGGTDAAVSTQPAAAQVVASISNLASTTSYYIGPFSVAQAFGGTLPASWSLVIWNDGCGTLSVTGTDHTLKYQGVQFQYT